MVRLFSLYSHHKILYYNYKIVVDRHYYLCYHDVVTTRNENNDLATAGEKLNKYLEETFRNKSAVARAAGISIQSFHAILKGRQPLDTATLVRICRVLMVDPRDFIDDL